MCYTVKKSPETGTSSVDLAQQSRFYLKTATESSLRNAVFPKINRTVFLDKDRTMDDVQKHNICKKCLLFCTIVEMFTVRVSEKCISIYVKVFALNEVHFNSFNYKLNTCHGDADNLAYSKQSIK
jgi:hypothetical protein